ncbi:hypothetical protein ThidrDRAFT_1200 [Thiorhodococcus drewsii AZ1]|uniref:Uncharacterized protein n=1 Tax=Thiorhodococcus drewsii AZ1 TaxID=765913 RepID=G2DYT8_9GAMM|nr:hypothetical protein ThidrDRAFT_1200 [Thiorhodococcus drewsii AZ1]
MPARRDRSDAHRLRQPCLRRSVSGAGGAQRSGSLPSSRALSLWRSGFHSAEYAIAIPPYGAFRPAAAGQPRRRVGRNSAAYCAACLRDEIGQMLADCASRACDDQCRVLEVLSDHGHCRHSRALSPWRSRLHSAEYAIAIPPYGALRPAAVGQPRRRVGRNSAAYCAACLRDEIGQMLADCASRACDDQCRVLEVLSDHGHCRHREH